MSQLTGLRQQVVAALQDGGLTSAEYVGETITPPCAVAVPADPYLELMPSSKQVPFGTYLVSVDVLVVAARDTAARQAAGMDSLIEEALTALDQGDLDVRSVSRPGVIKLAGVNFMASVIRVEETKRL